MNANNLAEAIEDEYAHKNYPTMLNIEDRG